MTISTTLYTKSNTHNKHLVNKLVSYSTSQEECACSSFSRKAELFINQCAFVGGTGRPPACAAS